MRRYARWGIEVQAGSSDEPLRSVYGLVARSSRRSSINCCSGLSNGSRSRQSRHKLQSIGAPRTGTKRESAAATMTASPHPTHSSSSAFIGHFLTSSPAIPTAGATVASRACRSLGGEVRTHRWEFALQLSAFFSIKGVTDKPSPEEPNEPPGLTE